MADGNDRDTTTERDSTSPSTEERTRELDTDTTRREERRDSTPFTQQVGRIVMIVIAVLFGVFAVANVDSVTFNWIFGEGDVPLILLLVASFGLGALVAWLATERRQRRR
ncbi:MAG: LapA family protein [Nitriliruptorales bacterium]|nr:LapA family protein [Nitriliruptorales bacterium]